MGPPYFKGKGQKIKPYDFIIDGAFWQRFNQGSKRIIE